VLARLSTRQSRGRSAHAMARSQLHPLVGRSVGEDAPRGGVSGRSRNRTCEEALEMFATEAASTRQSLFGPRSKPSRRSGEGTPRRPEGRLPSALHRNGAPMKDAQRGEFDGNSRGVRSLSAFRARESIAPVYLTEAVRSRGFSPPQRFDPPRASWLCFTPHPPLGFVVVFRAFPTRPAVTPLGVRCSPAVWLARSSSRANPRPTPYSREGMLPARLRSPNGARDPDSASSSRARHRPSTLLAEASRVLGERPRPGRGASRDSSRRVRFAKGRTERPRQARARDFRALLRPSVRARKHTIKRTSEPMLS
jgi:hypothetical protein